MLQSSCHSHDVIWFLEACSWSCKRVSHHAGLSGGPEIKPSSPFGLSVLSSNVSQLMLLWQGQRMICECTYALKMGDFPLRTLGGVIPIPVFNYCVYSVYIYVYSFSVHTCYLYFQNLNFPNSLDPLVSEQQWDEGFCFWGDC